MTEPPAGRSARLESADSHPDYENHHAMKSSIAELLKFANEIVADPRQFARKPEVAHGLVEVFGMAMLQWFHRTPFNACMARSLFFSKLATIDICDSSPAVVLLCDDRFSPVMTSFKAFQLRAPVYLELIAIDCRVPGKQPSPFTPIHDSKPPSRIVNDALSCTAGPLGDPRFDPANTVREMAWTIAARPLVWLRGLYFEHGNIEALAWIMLREALGKPLAECRQICSELLQTVNGNTRLLLFDDTETDHRRMADVFQANSREFLILLEKTCGLQPHV